MPDDDPSRIPRANDPWYVSPMQHTLADLYEGSFATRVDIIAAHFRGWMFDHARLLASSANPRRDDSAAAILTLTSPYFEAISEFITGEDSTNNSKAFFRAGFRRVFPTLTRRMLADGHPEAAVDAIIDSVYKDIRCGLLHNAAPRPRVCVAWGQRFALGIQYRADGEVEIISVGPARFAECAENHLDGYVAELKASSADSELRARFDRGFALRFGTLPRTGKRIPLPTISIRLGGIDARTS